MGGGESIGDRGGSVGGRGSIGDRGGGVGETWVV